MMKAKIFVAVILTACALAEPPVGDYPYPDYAAQRSLSDTYGPPSFARTQNLSPVYGAPEQNSRLSKQYLPAQRSVSQEYGVPRSFDSFEYPEANVPSQQYGVPSTGFPEIQGREDEYNTRNVDYQTRTSTRLSQKYGPPARVIDTSVRDLTRQYGVPKTRSQTVPKSFKTRSSFGVPSEIQDYNTKGFSVPSDSYGAPVLRSFDSKHISKGVPQKPVFKTESQSYVPPGDSYSKMPRFGAVAVSTSYGVPRLSSQYGVPNERSKPSETYGVPIARSFEAVSKSNAFPSSSYLPPSNAMPSTEYGAPDADILARQGYSYARNALDELINQEPANYDFGYKVNDLRTGSDFGHSETRQENKAEGSYFVVLPDGTKQVVEYEADDQGFRPRISVEAVDLGYDENASNLAKSGPY